VEAKRAGTVLPAALREEREGCGGCHGHPVRWTGY